MAYQKRIVDEELERRLQATGAVVIEGPKACGKTSTARQKAASELLLDVDEDARTAVGFNPRLVLEGPTPRLIDEWQLAPEIWNHIRRTVDDRGRPGQFILTGSAVPTDDITRHTGAGRLTRLRMRPMSLFETGASSGEISVRSMLAGDAPKGARSELDVNDLFNIVSVGGWPAHLGRDSARAIQANRDYLNEIRRVDIRQVDDVGRDPARVGRLLQSIARNVATSTAVTTLARDAGGPEAPLKRHTAADYIETLERLMVLEEQPAWAPHLRSRSRLRTSPKLHFTDPSLAVAALRAGPDQLARDLELFGLLFESLVIRDLRIYGQAAGAEVFHYRDNTGLEVDAIVERADGLWAAVEVKLGGERSTQEGAESLTRFVDRVDRRRCGDPAMLAVVVGSGSYAYQRDDKVWVIPIGTLGP